MATVDTKKLENKLPTSLVMYAFMSQRSPNINAAASMGLGLMVGHFTCSKPDTSKLYLSW